MAVGEVPARTSKHHAPAPKRSGFVIVGLALLVVFSGVVMNASLTAPISQYASGVTSWVGRFTGWQRATVDEEDSDVDASIRSWIDASNADGDVDADAGKSTPSRTTADIDGEAGHGDRSGAKRKSGSTRSATRMDAEELADALTWGARHARDRPSNKQAASLYVRNFTQHPVHEQILQDLEPFHRMFGGRGSGDPGRMPLEALTGPYAKDRASVRRLYLCAIINGSLYMDGQSWGKDREWSPKARGWVKQLHSVLRTVAAAKLPIPDTMFLIQFSSMPYVNRPDALIPVLSMAKSDANADLLIPNPYFGSVEEWDIVSGKLLAAAQKRRWETRKAVAFWRGACVSWPGSRPRVELVNLHKLPHFDVAFTKSCPVSSWPPLGSDAKTDAAVKREISHLPTTGRIDPGSFAQHKYLVHMPGSTQGSYSRNMQIVLGVGGVVLLWQSPFYEFYYRSLQNGHHVIDVNASTVSGTVRALVSNDAAARTIAAATIQWYKDNLRGVHIAEYWYQLLVAYSRMLAFRPTLAMLTNPCTCSAAALHGRGAFAALANPAGNPVPPKVRKCNLC